MSKRFGDARMPTLRDKINSLEEAGLKNEVSEKSVKVSVNKGRGKVKVKKLN